MFFGHQQWPGAPRGIASCPQLSLDQHHQLLAFWQLEQGGENTASLMIV
tara:strand:+ start:1578 stop:1724 length:147 start_codon:yes stop_codon:yes gene_type:complete